MTQVQDASGVLAGEEKVPIPADAVLIFETDVQGPDGHPLPPLHIRSGANSIKWSYELNTFQTSTLGGEVVQVLSAFVGPMTIEGMTAGIPTDETLPKYHPGWTEQSFTPVDELMEIAEWFLAYMQATGLGDPGAQFRDERTIRFRYPIREWDFRIWVTQLNGFRIDKSVTAIPWSITAEIMSDNALDYFQGTTMASMQGPLNDRMLQVAISPGYEFAKNPFVNPSLAQNDPNNTARNIGAQFQGLVGAWATGDFMTWGFSSLAVVGGRDAYNKKALPQGYQETSGLSHPQNFGALAHPLGDNAGLNKGFGVNKYWIGGGGGVDYNVNGDYGYQGGGGGSGGGGGGSGGPPPPSGGGTCGDNACYNKANVKIKDPAKLAKAIDDWMRSKNSSSPLIGQGSLIVSLAQKYNINPFLYPVVALIESSLGTDCCHHDNSNHNTWGDLTGPPNAQGNPSDCVVFGSFVEATQAYFQNLTTNRNYAGTKTVCDVIAVASPASKNPGYLEKLLGYFAELIAAASDSVDCGTAGSGKPDCKGYVAPFSGVRTGRVDQGVDYCAPVGTPIRAIGKGIVVDSRDDSGWECGHVVAYTLCDGPNKGDTIYVAESIDRAVNIGDCVSAGTVIGHFNSCSGCIEIGFAKPGTDAPCDDAAPGNTPPTPHGYAMARLLKCLGVPIDPNYPPGDGPSRGCGDDSGNCGKCG